MIALRLPLTAAVGPLRAAPVQPFSDSSALVSVMSDSLSAIGFHAAGNGARATAARLISFDVMFMAESPTAMEMTPLARKSILSSERMAMDLLEKIDTESGFRQILAPSVQIFMPPPAVCSIWSVPTTGLVSLPSAVKSS